ISQREHDRLFASFNNQDEPTLTFPTPEQARRQEELKAQAAAAQKELADYDRQRKEQPASAPVKSDPARERLAKRLSDLREQERELAKAIPGAMVLREREPPRATSGHIRGAVLRKGPALQPG